MFNVILIMHSYTSVGFCVMCFVYVVTCTCEHCLQMTNCVLQSKHNKCICSYHVKLFRVIDNQL